MKQILILSTILILFSCSQKKQKLEKKQTTPKLTFLWETDTLLTTVESVIFDAKTNFIYTSNIEGNPGAKDAKGSISKIDNKGNIIKRNWIQGLNAPKGMGIFQGKLYVTDIDRIVEIDINKGEIDKDYPVEGAVFLNDIAIDSEGAVYFSDTDINKIFVMKKGEIYTFLEMSSPNGLLVENKYLLAVSWTEKTFNKIDFKTKEITQITDSIPNPDGIEALGNGAHFVSSWNGQVYLVSNDGTKNLLLDTSKEKVFSADIDFIKEENILLVPTFFKNKIVAYQYSE